MKSFLTFFLLNLFILCSYAQEQFDKKDFKLESTKKPDVYVIKNDKAKFEYKFVNEEKFKPKIKKIILKKKYFALLIVLAEGVGTFGPSDVLAYFIFHKQGKLIDRRMYDQEVSTFTFNEDTIVLEEEGQVDEIKIK